MTPEELRQIAAAQSKIGQLDIHGFYGGYLLQGWALRVLFRSGRRYDDMLLFEVDERSEVGYGVPPGGEAKILSRTPFAIEGERGPVLVSERIIPMKQRDPVAWVDAIMANIVPGTRTSDVAPAIMQDDRFWALIELLRPDPSGEGLEELLAKLIECSFGDVIAFRNTFFQKLRDLDHPGNTVCMGGIVSADASLYYRCEIIASGREMYEARLAEPREGGPEAGAWGELLLTIADDASVYELPEAEIQVETGSNPINWPDAPIPPEPAWTRLPSPGPFSYDVQLARLRMVEDPAVVRRHFTSFVAYAIRDDGRIRELMGCLTAGSFPSARTEIDKFLHVHLQEDESLHPSTYVYQSGIDGVGVGDSLVEIARRSRLSMDDYVATYFTGEKPPPRAT